MHSIGACRAWGVDRWSYRLLAHRSAEKGVTILERGITSSRWRDDVDIVQLAKHGIDPDVLLDSARAVARYRQVPLRPIAGSVTGYGATSQAKWAAWRRKEGLEAM